MEQRREEKMSTEGRKTLESRAGKSDLSLSFGQGSVKWQSAGEEIILKKGLG